MTRQLVVADEQRRGFWLTNHAINPFLRPLLRDPLGRRMGRRLAVLGYRGRRTGERRELVVMYVREGGRVWVLVGWPQRKRWWRNMIEPMPVDIRLAGRYETGVAQAVNDRDQPEEVRQALEAYLLEFPRARRAADQTEGPTVMVRIDLHEREGLDE
ncbi:MAG TPA: nitroreductase/quinone reductase family protein [Ilumatobacteraceae bacterium]|nr:nitroreductase/quinone reductase family protein [Ilumatobacteraceae bacterium]